jgi:hypothetical protein
VQAIIASSLIQGFIRNRLPLCANLIPHLDIRFSETHRPNFLEQKPLAPIDHFQRTYIAAPDLETKHLTLLLSSLLDLNKLAAKAKLVFALCKYYMLERWTLSMSR